MLSRRISRFAVLAAVFGLAASIAVSAQDSTRRGRKYKAPPPTSRVEVTILRNDDGKPIENAAVVFQLIGDKGNMELKTNEDGKTVIDVLPTGSKVLLQVIAKGYQTYGQDYQVDKSQMAIEVKLKRPGQQYSIYKMHEQAADAGKSPDKTADTSDKDVNKDGAAKNGSKDKSAESAKQNDDKPDSQPQPQ
ncbi:MAG: carboxypeptidase-like regulatory domain-containing protein [Terracidiphilus sp.]